MRARRRALLALLAVLGLAVPVPAQPPASLKILIPADPGGSWDQMARAMEQALRTEKLVAGPIRLTNRGGGDGTVGLARFARVKGEAGSLMVMGQTMIAAIVTGGSPRTLASVTPIARLTSEPAVIVVPASSPFRTLKDLTERLKKDADTVSITGGSRGGSDHILAALIAESQGVPASRVNYVAYAGGGDAVAALLEARVAAGIGGWGELQAHVGSGKLRVLAISSPRRVPGINAPTPKEQGVAIEFGNWRGVVAPEGISAADRKALLDTMDRLAKSATWKQTLRKQSWEDAYLAGAAFGEAIKAETARIATVLRGLGVAP